MGVEKMEGWRIFSKFLKPQKLLMGLHMLSREKFVLSNEKGVYSKRTTNCSSLGQILSLQSRQLFRRRLVYMKASRKSQKLHHFSKMAERLPRIHSP